MRSWIVIPVQIRNLLHLEVARAVAALATLEDASLADRFATATAEVLKARLHTTDNTLADALQRRKRLITRY